jgi:hypothetical protein
MKKVLVLTISLSILVGFFRLGMAQAPAFSSLVVAAGNGNAVVTFDQIVASDAAGTLPLTSAQFVLTISSSIAGGTVTAGSVILTSVTHNVGDNSATLSFSIAGIADGSEILTLQAADAASIYSTAGTVTPMDGTEISIANLLDLLGPFVSISAPSASLANSISSLSYDVTYTGADAITLANSDVTLNATGGASATVSVSGSGPTTRTITLTGFTGNGTIDVSIAGSTATDLAGNIAAAAGPSATISVDATAPIVSISAPSAAFVNSTSSISFDVTYTGADAITLINSDVTLNATGGAGSTISVSGSGSTTRTITLTGFTGNGTIDISIAGSTATDLAGNAATAAGPSSSITVDNIPPLVASITNASPKKGFGTEAIAASSVSFLVTFTETSLPLTGIDPTDFTVLKDASINYTSPIDVTGTGATRTVTINGITGIGRLSLGLTDDNTILDAASNPLAGAANGSLTAAFGGTQYHTIVLPEPSSSVTNLVSSANTNSITITWNDAVLPATQSTHYLVRLKKRNATFAIATLIDNIHDGVDYTDTNFIDGTLANYVAYESTLPTGTITFNNLSSGTDYDIEVYPLTYSTDYPIPSSANWDYRFTSPLLGSAATSISPSGTVSLVSSAAFISSIETALTGASAPQLNATQNFQFTIKDDGATNNVDDADFKFSTIVIKEGTGSANSISNWTQAIEFAELSDGVNSPVVVTTSAVSTSPNTITFNVNSATTGFIADDAAKTYTLRIALKRPLGGTLPSTIDGKNFEFRVDQSSFVGFYDNVTNGEASSTLAAVSVESGNTNIKIEVEATQLDFTTQPASGFAGINQPIPSEVVIMARDANSALDLDYDKNNSNVDYRTATLFTPTGGARVSIVNPANPYNEFIKGVITLRSIASSNPLTGTLFYTGPGDGTLIANANGLASNDGVSIACNPIAVVHTQATGIPAGIGGITTSTNLKGGSQNNNIFGVNFRAPFVTTAEPSLRGFSIIFDNPFVTATTTTFIPSNIKIFESINGGQAVNISSYGGRISLGQSDSLAATGAAAASKNRIQIDFPTPRALSTPAGASLNLSYFLFVDVDPSASSSASSLRPSLKDEGYRSTSDNYILTTTGSATASVRGANYTFSSINPPRLITSSPHSGQLNVDPNQRTISLTFDVAVVSLDGFAYLYKKSDNSLLATLRASTGVYVPPVGDPKSALTAAATKTIVFDIPSGLVLEDDEVYYIGISQGSFDTKTNTGEGITDDNLNYFAGISFNQTLYFKTAKRTAPVMVGTDPTKYFVSSTVVSFNCSFDQKGTAYYMMVAKNDPVPTNAQIKGETAYGRPVIKRGSFAITQLAPIVQSATFNGEFIAGNYDIWVYAENDALPTAVSTSTPYSSYLDSSGILSFPQVSELPSASTPPLPTISIRIGFSASSITLNKPTIQICANSPVVITDPIIITEGNNKANFDGGAQDVNILLPSGFQFYETQNPLTVELFGSDFQGPAKIIFINNTLLKLQYTNIGNSSHDNIIISNLKIMATSQDIGGPIQKFSGTGLTGVDTLARIGSSFTVGQNFTNSYTLVNASIFAALPIPIRNTVTVIPDNFNSEQGTVTLIPTLPVNDYGPSYFAGPSVTNDLLNLTAVTKDSPFGITMTHKDMNGCISTKTVQYTIYDHTNAIASLAQKNNSNGNINKITIANLNYPNLSGNVPNREVTRFNDLAGYSLVALVADTTIQHLPNRQIMQGAAWKSIIETLPGSAVPVVNGANYQVSFDPILNAKFNGISIDPYDNFSELAPQRNKYQNNTYWTGGSLGTVKFTAEYLSLADGETYIPRIQELEIFLPARPIIQIDPANNLSAIDSISSPGNKIAVFCEAGGDINLKGYPAAQAGESTGTFKLFQENGNEIKTIPSGAFIANTNGTATFKPSLFANGFANIIVTYSFQRNDAPEPPATTGIGWLIIRIEPNPTARFAMLADITNVNTPTESSYCENRDIRFDPSSSTVGGSGTLTEYSWDFGDPNSLNSTSRAISPTRKYSISAKYTPSLIVTSSYGCSSASRSNNLSVGIVPIVSAEFTGTSVNDVFQFTSTTRIASGTVDDGIAQYDWDFGDGSKATSKTSNETSNKYANPNDGTNNRSYSAKLSVTSKLGCVDSKMHDVVVLPFDDLASGESIYNFESDQKWQALPLTGSIWQNGKPTIDPISSTDPDNKVWKTNISGAYAKDNRSYLYSPVFKISALKKPIVSFYSWFELSGDDAVVLEYSIDNKNITDEKNKKWTVLGYFDPLLDASGLNWYTAQSLTTKPGQQATGDYGWSKNSVVDPVSKISVWLDSRHSLTSNSSIPMPSGNDNVVFRFAFSSATNSAVTTQRGFALDKFRIGERTRLVVVESFSNLGNSINEKEESKTLKDLTELTKVNGAFDRGDILNINYHVAFPDKDPFNLDNPADPSARARFYNIFNSPRSRVDGLDGSPKNSANPLFSSWKNYFNLQQLKLPTATIELTGTKSNTDGSITIPVKIKALEDLDTTSVLHVGIVERSINFTTLSTAALELIEQNNRTQSNSELVLKKMLPNAAGTKFSKALKMNDSRDFGTFSWTPDPAKLYPSANDLHAFAFIQNSRTGEIYQAAVIAVVNDPTVVTDIGELIADDIVIFPNPANKDFTVELPTVATQQITYQLFDQVGKIMHTGIIHEGQKSTTIKTDNFSNGIYIIHLKNDTPNIIRKKVMILKD